MIQKKREKRKSARFRVIFCPPCDSAPPLAPGPKRTSLSLLCTILSKPLFQCDSILKHLMASRTTMKTRSAAAMAGLGKFGKPAALTRLNTSSSSTPASPSSLQSAPMEESESESETPPSKSREDDENKYPVDGLFMTQAEKAEIMNMREVEREQILAERAQEKDRIHQNKLLRQLVSNEEQRNKKRSASTADLDDGQRKTPRVRTKLGKADEKNSAIDTLKEPASREERAHPSTGRGPRAPEGPVAVVPGTTTQPTTTARAMSNGPARQRGRPSRARPMR